MGEFPQGEADPNTQDGSASSGSEGEPGAENSDGEATGTGDSESEPGFGTGGGAGDDDSLPDLTDEPSLEDALESFEESMGQSAGDLIEGGSTEGGSTEGGSTEGGSGAGTSGREVGNAAGTASAATGNAGSEAPSYGRGNGPRTTAEQIMILHGELERKESEFDAMILAEQAAQRRAARGQTSASASTTASGQNGSGGSQSGPDEGMGGGIRADDYSTEDGLYGSSTRSGGVGIPQNTAKFPPPANIPTGSDDDVVARQLREAAMRETDPELREKLWDEYRKYKGIDN